MVYDYINTKPPLNEDTLASYGIDADVIKHGWLKDQMAAVHKYIKRWRGPSGKWVYQYANSAKKAGAKVLNNAKTKALDLYTKFNRRGWYHHRVSTNYGKNAINDTYPEDQKYKDPRRKQSKYDVPTSRSGQRGSRAEQGIEAGRKRVAEKKTKALKLNQTAAKKKRLADIDSGKSKNTKARNTKFSMYGKTYSTDYEGYIDTGRKDTKVKKNVAILPKKKRNSAKAETIYRQQIDKKKGRWKGYDDHGAHDTISRAPKTAKDRFRSDIIRTMEKYAEAEAVEKKRKKASTQQRVYHR